MIINYMEFRILHISLVWIFSTKVYPKLIIFERCERSPVPTFQTAGLIPTLLSETVGVPKRKGNLWRLFHFGCIATTHQVTFRRSGMNTTASCLPLLDYRAMKPPKNSIFIFCAPQIWHRLLKCLMVLLTNLSMLLYS
jgi:hypothetical protein